MYISIRVLVQSNTMYIHSHAPLPSCLPDFLNHSRFHVWLSQKMHLHTTPTLLLAENLQISTPQGFAKLFCIPHICHRHHRRCLCKFFLSGVIFSLLNMKMVHVFYKHCVNYTTFVTYMDHFHVQSRKFYTWQKKFTQAPPVVPVTNMRYDHKQSSLHYTSTSHQGE